MKRTLLLTLLFLIPVFVAVARTTGQADTGSSAAIEKWEYLIVSAPSRTNFSPSGNSYMRKETGNFGVEAFVLEQQLDKLGANGWELVSISGPPTDPIYYFKRPK